MLLFLKNLLFTLIVPGTVAVYVPLWFARNRPAAEGPMLALAIALLALGGVIYAWCVWDFAAYGRATPAPIDAPKKLVVRGLYRYVRNPIYVGVLTALLGWAAMFQARIFLIYTLCVAAGFHLFVVFYEQRALARLFGAEYCDYCDRVGRWLPRLRR